ncbi:head decoration protein [Paraburkholderia solisilvae]|uniref:Head decoration protein n=1 Tax=Paraburkholderia solisilvae TaxID=624376 RepID=A0A6J5DZ23_9BURK|nr:head decoration protein [Paraburkholderia solisilvae]CAB3759409.1 hypothetical protein LMG29739_03146 [Paraburkholderia solisilvae]
MPTILTEARHDAGFLVSEARGHRSRDRATLSGGAKMNAGQVLGRKGGGTVTAAAKAGNSGNGVFTLDAITPLVANAQLGVYVVRCTVAAVNGGTFRVFDPSGDVLGDVAVGTTFNDQIKFFIGDGSTDFVVGDEFDVTVSALSNAYIPLNLAATDGSQIAVALSFANVDVTAADQPGTIVSRDAEVNGSELFWPTGATAAQISEGVTQLEAVGIIIR